MLRYRAASLTLPKALSVFSVFLFVPFGWAQTDKSNYKTYKIEVRLDDSAALLEGIDEDEFYERQPWSKLRPDPFYYASDVSAADSSDADSIFLVSGVNCTGTLKKVKTITGVPMEILQKRASYGSDYKTHDRKGSNPFSNLARGSRPPEWRELNNVAYRASPKGFIADKESLRNRLIEDNNFVLGRGLTHQEVAEPLLQAIESYTIAVQRGVIQNADEKKTVSFESKGKSYKIERAAMGGAGTFASSEIFLRMQMARSPGGVDEAAIAKKMEKERLSSPSLRAGWVGTGVQGSFFNDELFSSWVMVIKDDKGNTFKMDALTPSLIHRYGFYQGGPYRTSPESIIKFFGIHPKGDAQVKLCARKS